MARKSGASSANPYRVLYWMGAGVLVLFVGILALVMLRPKPGPVPDPERTLIWIYEADDRAGPAALAVIEESRSGAWIAAVPFAAPAEARQVFANEKASKAQEFLAGKLERKLHNRLFLPYGVVQKIIDAAGGIAVGGASMNGTEAVAFVKAGGEQMAARAAVVLLSMADSAATNGVNMGASEALALARQVETDMDLTALPDVLGRWSGYGRPRLEKPASSDYADVRRWLLPDTETK